jgi:hypothetical protein
VLDGPEHPSPLEKKCLDEGTEIEKLFAGSKQIFAGGTSLMSRRGLRIDDRLLNIFDTRYLLV